VTTDVIVAGSDPAPSWGARKAGIPLAAAVG
jgi:hypothetical protein